MKTSWLIASISAIIAFGLAVTLVLEFRAERYKIVYSTFLQTNNTEVLKTRGIVCYSNEELRRALNDSNILTELGMKRFDLDAKNLTAVIMVDHVVDHVIGQGGIGFITVRRSPAKGISFCVLKGRKRVLQMALSPSN